MSQSFLALLVLIAAASGARIQTQEQHDSPIHKIDELLAEKATKSGDALLQQSEVAPKTGGHRSILATVLLLASGASGFNVGVRPGAGHGALSRATAHAQPGHVMNMGGGPIGSPSGPARVPLPSGVQDLQAEGQVFNWGDFQNELQGSGALFDMNQALDGVYNEEASFSAAPSSVNTPAQQPAQQMTKARILEEIEVMQLADVSDLEALGVDAAEVKKSLGEDDSSSMPPAVRLAGEAAVDMLAAKVLSVFKGGGSESMLEANDGSLHDLVKMLGLDPISAELGLGDGSANIKDYVDETVTALKKNPILLEFARQFAKLPAEMQKAAFPSGPNAESEIRQGVVYSYMLNTIAKTLMYEPMKAPGDEQHLIYEQMVSIFEDMSDARKAEWEPFLNLFEKMKFASVVKPFLLNKTDTLRGPVNEKSGLAQGKSLAQNLPAGAGLSINILEAMFRDAQLGNPDNAQAGFELMTEPNSQDDRHDGEWLREDGSRTGVRLMKMPLPKAWSNLYSSWNAAFVSNYKDNPMFYAKLINPLTLGMYHSGEGEGSENLYMWSRAVQLFVHLQYVKMSRADLQSEVPNSEPWQSETLTQLWGKVNKVAADAYHQRVEETVTPSTVKEWHHHARFRAAAKILWKGVNFMGTRGQ